MAWAQTDLDAVESAIVTLASGARVATITNSDGKSVTYTQASLLDLLKLRDAIKASIVASGTTTSGRIMTTLAQFSKG